MPSYRAPGVYVEEVSSGARPIQSVSTTTAAFFGLIEDSSAELRRPHYVTSFSQFKDAFAPDPCTTPSQLARAVSAFFENGGTGAYVVRLADDQFTLTHDDLQLLDEFDDIGLVAAPCFTDPESHTALINHCEAHGFRFAVLDLPEAATDIQSLTTHADAGGILPQSSVDGIAAVYAPWIVTRDPFSEDALATPPSGALCGIFARNDAVRGIHETPANIAVRGALDLTATFSHTDSTALSLAHVNELRVFSDGIRVWGARTLAPHGSEWRYISVKRMFMMIEKSVLEGTKWAIFQPNDETLWKSIVGDVGAFLNSLWRQGAVAGATPNEAFFVKCGRETMTQADLDTGQLIIEIGISPVKPAEFIVVQIKQITGRSP